MAKVSTRDRRAFELHKVIAEKLEKWCAIIREGNIIRLYGSYLEAGGYIKIEFSVAVWDDHIRINSINTDLDIDNSFIAEYLAVLLRSIELSGKVKMLKVSELPNE